MSFENGEYLRLFLYSPRWISSALFVSLPRLEPPAEYFRDSLDKDKASRVSPQI